MSKSTGLLNRKKEALKEKRRDGRGEEPKEEWENEADGAQDDQAGQPREGPAESLEPDEDLNTKYLRLMADFQNYKRRTEKEKGDIYAFANEKILSELLEVIDDFDRALGLEGASAEPFVEGMRMIFKNFHGVLEKYGMEEIPALGIAFDPNVHNAVMMVKNDECEGGIVCEVLQKGYKLNNRVIRPSMVKVTE